VRIATWNVQWFDHLFGDDSTLACDEAPSGREGITRRDQTRAIAHVLRALDADALVVIEAPDSRRRSPGGLRALEYAAERFGLRTTEALNGFPSDTQQEITLLYDPARLSARHDPQGGDPPGFNGSYRARLNGHLEPIRWSKPPLEVEVLTARGTVLRLIGVHAKSKAPHGARNEAQALRIAIENRRKQLAQCLWLRARVERHLEAGDPLIVLGDFNDGPGLDEHEERFGRSGVEIVLGEGDGTRLFDPHAALALGGPTAAAPSTARFRIPPDMRWLSALLDYVMVSPDLRALQPRWRIWHPFDDPGCWRDEALRDALLHASDHFPVSLDIDL
jgi:endonuclease/exonuclease/phosphatase family metal-dependent hydrolase